MTFFYTVQPFVSSFRLLTWGHPHLNEYFMKECKLHKYCWVNYTLKLYYIVSYGMHDHKIQRYKIEQINRYQKSRIFFNLCCQLNSCVFVFFAGQSPRYFHVHSAPKNIWAQISRKNMFKMSIAFPRKNCLNLDWISKLLNCITNNFAIRIIDIF